ncbi:ABC transporter permease subunit, partial [Candidatus Saccharibacteria bacterium]|nr:ABC transporter permease subunit [Candidatus Saccharibacteria bacterium]
VGFLNSQIFFLMLPLLGGVLSIGLGGSLLAREEQDGTIESLLARPVSRGRILWEKAVAGAAILGLVSGLGGLATIISARVVGISVSSWTIATTSLVCFLLCLSFGAVSFLVTSMGKARGASIGIGALVALGGYMISSLAGTITWLEWPARFLPFHYYQSDALLRGQYSWLNALYFVALTVACGLASWIVFRRRDID